LPGVKLLGGQLRGRATIRRGREAAPGGHTIPLPSRSLVLSGAVALAVFFLALDRGGYGLGTRGALGIAIWWAVLVFVLVGVWPRVAVPRAAVVTGGLLCAFCVLTGASALWADSAEGVSLELGRTGLFLGVFAVTVLASTRTSAAAWTDGMGAGIAAVAVLALADRCFAWHDPSELRSFLPGAETRLGYPLGYWNGLGILVGIGVPFLLRSAVAGGRAVLRGLAVGVLPAIGAALYLTSSRGGVAVAVVGALTFVLLAGRALPAMLALAVGGAGAAVAIAVLEARPELVDGPLQAAAAAGQGESAAPLLLLACLGSGLMYGLVSSTAVARVRLRRGVAWAVGLLAITLAVAGVVAADPAARLESFKQPPNLEATDRAGFVRDHLLSGEGSGRWQFWSSALDQFEQHSLGGGGAGSWGGWWLRQGSLAFYVRDAHSLYLETLGELGLLGFALLVVAFGSALAASAGRLRGLAGDVRPAVAAATAGLVAFLVGAALDWIWELAVLAVIGAVCAGLLTGPATAVGEAPPARAGRRNTYAARGAVAVLAACLILVQAVPWLVERQLSASREELADGDAEAAEARALNARSIQSWAASPHLQLALVREHRNDFEGARRAIEKALELETENWRLWVVAARVEAGAGELERSRRHLLRARELHPRSPLFDFDEADQARIERALDAQ
jgi:O-antigen ligase